MSLFTLEGRVALVTGGGRGIGRGIAEGLADHGAKVVVAARTDAQTQETAEAIQASMRMYSAYPLNAGGSDPQPIVRKL